VQTIKQAGMELYHSIKLRQSQCFDLMSDLGHTMTRLTIQQQSLENNKNGVKHLVELEFEKLEKMIAARKAEVLGQVNAIYVAKNEKLQETIDVTTNRITELQNCMTKTESLLSSHKVISPCSSMEINPSADSRPISPTSTRGMSSKDVYALWTQGPDIKKQLDALVVDDEPMKDNVMFLNCSFDTMRQELEEIISSFGHVQSTEHLETPTQIFVRGLDGKTMVFKLYTWETRVVDLMNRIYLKVHIPISKQRLYFQGKMLYAESAGKWRTLAEYGIDTESTVHLSISLTDDQTQ
jgi:hypothetical protein